MHPGYIGIGMISDLNLGKSLYRVYDYDSDEDDDDDDNDGGGGE